MILPIDRKRFAKRNRLDEEQAIAESRARSPADRLRAALELSDFVRALSRATGVEESPPGLEEESAVYARPLRLLAD